MLGGILAVLAAATFGFNNAAIRRGVLSGSLFQGLAITVPMGVPMFLVAAVATGNLHHLMDFPAASYFWMSAAGISHFVWGRYCNYRATRAIGGNLAGPWQQTQLILALFLAILVLGETLTVLKIAGIALVIFGGAITTRGKHNPKTEVVETAKSATPEKTKKQDFVPKYAEGYTFALLSAVGYGLSPILIRLGLESRGLGFSVIGGLISYSAATLLVAVILFVAGKWRHVCAVEPVAVKWFSFAGALVGTSQMLRYAALSLAPVTVVTPIQSTSAIFRTLFGWVINREHEVFGVWVYLGMVFSIAGAVALTISADFVLAHVALPDALVHIAKWRWPI
ncbi:MAG TPA: EamA family transporter [Herbaspirillum sp.]|jgi:drug/metabolite transporter (DMT)-like permease